MFVVNNWKYFTENSELYDIKTRKTRTYFNHNKTYLSIKQVLIMLASIYIIIFLLEQSCCQVILISLKKLTRISDSYIHFVL
jgi:hypothetical protein